MIVIQFFPRILCGGSLKSLVRLDSNKFEVRANRRPSGDVTKLLYGCSLLLCSHIPAIIKILITLCRECCIVHTFVTPEMASLHLFLAVTTVIALFTATDGVQDLDRRIAVVDSSKGFLAFATDFSQGRIKVSSSSDSKTWGELCVRKH